MGFNNQINGHTMTRGYSTAYSDMTTGNMRPTSTEEIE